MMKLETMIVGVLWAVEQMLVDFERWSDHRGGLV